MKEMTFGANLPYHRSSVCKNCFLHFVIIWNRWIYLFIFAIPLWVLPVKEKFLFLLGQAVEPFGVTYLWKCFSQVLSWECGSFLDDKGDTEQHSLSYRYLWQVTFCVPVPHIYPSVGYCVVYLSSGLSTTFKKINESQLHTFFVYS